MRMPRYAIVICLALLAGLLPGTAGAASLHVTEGTVTHIADGDTIDVRINGTVRRVRLTGIQAMEIGDCHADKATARLRELVAGKAVRLRAIDQNSRSGARLLRQVPVVRAGVWIDAAKELIDEGLALWSPHPPETHVNQSYRYGAQRAAAARRNLWDPAACRPGPQQDANVRIWAKGDADGVDADNLNDEWVRIHNRGGSALDLSGWRVRDGALRWYRFPAGASVQAERSGFSITAGETRAVLRVAPEDADWESWGSLS
jgi:endonuclease YncB( thermonuclease family)